MADTDLPLIVDGPPTTRRERMRAGVRRRIVPAAAVLALVEVVAFLIWRPSFWLVSIFAFLLMIVAFMAWARLKPGVLRDLVLIVAIAQGLVTVLPLAIGLSVFAGIILAVIVVIGLLVAVSRSPKK